jgi:hypothetical protein
MQYQLTSLRPFALAIDCIWCVPRKLRTRSSFQLLPLAERILSRLRTGAMVWSGNNDVMLHLMTKTDGARSAVAPIKRIDELTHTFSATPALGAQHARLS